MEVLPWYSYSKKVLFYSILIPFYLKVIFCRSHALCCSFFAMLSCDNAVWKAEISWDFWWSKLFNVYCKCILTVFCTWDSNAHLMLIYHGILLFSPHLVKNKLWLHFKSLIFSFLKEGANYMQKENKIVCTKLTPIFGILITNIYSA